MLFMECEKDDIVDVIIVGAGAAGMNAALVRSSSPC
jgi:thioredoxin reductase